MGFWPWKACLVALLWGAAPVLEVRFDGSPSSHSLRNFRMVVSEPHPGLPQFIAVVYVDDQPIVHDDSDNRTTVPVAPWMRRVEQDIPHHLKKAGEVFRGDEKRLREILVMLMAHFRHDKSTGPHTLQLMFSCELGPDGQPKGGDWKYAYDGEDLLELKKETSTWTFFKTLGKILEEKLDPLLGKTHQKKDYLDGSCVWWLWKYLEYRNKTLQRTETPTVKVARKKGDNGLETLICRVYGFYPKEISVTWLKDGKPVNLTRCVLPNSDRTFYTSLSTKVEPKEMDRYQCQVEHSSLPGPLDRAWEEPASNWGLTWGTVESVESVLTVLAVVILAVVTGVIYIYKRRPKGSNMSEPSSSSDALDRLKQLSQAIAGDPGEVTKTSPLTVLVGSRGGSYKCLHPQMPVAPDGGSDQKSDSCYDGDRGQVSVFFSNEDSAQVVYRSGNGDSGQVFYLSRHGDSGQWSPYSTTSPSLSQHYTHLSRAFFRCQPASGQNPKLPSLL